MQRSNRREPHTRTSEAAEDRDVIRYNKRYEAYVGSRTTETLIDNFLSFTTMALGYAVKVKDPETLENELKNNYIITKELSNVSGNLTLRCGRLLAVANAFLIAAKHVYFNAEEPPAKHPSHDSDGYPLAGVDEVPALQQYSVNDE